MRIHLERKRYSKYRKSVVIEDLGSKFNRTKLLFSRFVNAISTSMIFHLRRGQSGYFLNSKPQIYNSDINI